MIKLAFSVLSISGHYVDVGVVGDRIDIPLFPRVSREQVFHGSFWGNYNDISEVMALMDEGKIRHTLKVFGFDQDQRAARSAEDWRYRRQGRDEVLTTDRFRRNR